MNVHFDTKKLNAVLADLAQMRTRLDDLTVPLTAGAKRAREDTLQDFATGGAFSGEVWAAIPESTRKRDRYEDKRSGQVGTRPTTSHEPLRFSHRFMDTVTYFVQKFRAGVSLGPAYWLNYIGTTNPKTGAQKNPQREAGYISNETLEWTLDAIVAYAIRFQEAA